MRAQAITLIASILVATSLFAADPPKPVVQKLEQLASTFCNQTYALCIKAPCVPVVNASGDITSLACSCDVKAGWSMGPGSCQSRKPVEKNGVTFMISTYSNFYNV